MNHQHLQKSEIDSLKSEVDSLQTEIKLLGTENKLLKDDIKNKQKLIDSILEHNSNLIQAQNVFAQKQSVTRNTNDKSINHTNGNNDFRKGKKNESNVPKDGRFKELKASFKDLHPEAYQPKVRKNIIVIGDSIIKNANGRDVSRGDSVKFNHILGHQRMT